MRLKLPSLSVLAAACLFSLAACGDKESESVAIEEPAPTPPPASGVAVPEMKPTGSLAPSFGTAADGSTPAAPTGSAVPEMTPTGNMKQAVVPSQPTQPAPPPPTPLK